MIAELDRLAEKVEMARATIVKLREDNEELRARCDTLRQQLAGFEAVGGSPEDLKSAVEEIEAMSRERETLLQEREDIASRVRGLLEKVETIEELS